MSVKERPVVPEFHPGVTESGAAAAPQASAAKPGVPLLRLLVLAAGLAAVLAAAWLAFRTPRDPPLIAVLPFDDLNGDSAQAYVSRGLTEEIITQPGRVVPAGFGVIAGRRSV